MIESTYQALPPIKTVLIASSLTPASDPVVAQGVRLAQRLKARVVLVHAVQAQALGTAFGLEWTDGVMIESWRDDATERLLDQARRHGASDIDSDDLCTELGPPHRTVLRLARAVDADLLVVGPHEGPDRLQRLLGSTADRVMRGAPAPVLIVRGELDLDELRVVAPVDLSNLAADALRCGLSFLWQLGIRSGTEVEALFALSQWQREQAPQFSPEQVDRLAGEELRDFVERNVGDYPGDVATHVTIGDAVEAIVERLVTTSPELVVIGTHGHSGFERLVVGSVTARLAREAPCSLLVFPPLIAFESETRLAATPDP